MDNKDHSLLAVYADSARVVDNTTFGSAFIVGKTNIFTCNSLNVFVGSFTKSVHWFPVVSFLLFFRNTFVFDANCLLKLVFSEVGILYWRNTNIFTCNKLNEFAGPFAESVDWCRLFFCLLRNIFISMPSVFLMPVFSEVGILYWRDTDLFVTKK